MAMIAPTSWNVAALGAVLLAHAAVAQEQPPELTPAGKAALQSWLAGDGSSWARFPLPTCAFRGGLCGAVRRDLTVAVPPRYDWVGEFSDGRAAVRLGGLYGFVDEDGREVVEPKYRVVDDYRFGFAQVDVDGKSGLIDRDGRMVIAPKYGFVTEGGPDRFHVSDRRSLGGMTGSEDFSGMIWGDRTTTRLMRPPPMSLRESRGVIDISGKWIEPPSAPSGADKDNPLMRWAWRDNLWGLQRPDGSWLVEPKFQEADRLFGELTRVRLNGKVGFIDRKGKLAIEPTFDQAWPFVPGFDRTAVVRDGVFGVIDKTGAWGSPVGELQIPFAMTFLDRPSPNVTPDNSKAVRGWHFKKGDRWGFLDPDGRVVLDAEFDIPAEHCRDGTVYASKDKEWLRFKRDGSPIQPPNGRFIEGWCWNPPFPMKVGDKIGLVAVEGTPVTPFHFDAIVRVGAHAWNVKLGSRWGRIATADGRWLIEPKFDYLSADEGVVVAAVDGKRGFLSLDGSWLIEPKFDAARLNKGIFDRRRDPDSAFVTIAGATGLLRLKDQFWAIPPRPGVMCSLVSTTNSPENNAIIWQTDSKLVVLSPSGETWFDIDADGIGRVRESGLVPFLKNGKWGLVDTAGKIMVEPQFDELDWGFERGIAWARRGESWCAIDRRGRAVPAIACTGAVPVDPWPGPSSCKVEP